MTVLFENSMDSIGSWVNRGFSPFFADSIVFVEGTGSIRSETPAGVGSGAFVEHPLASPIDVTAATASIYARFDADAWSQLNSAFALSAWILNASGASAFWAIPKASLPHAGSGEWQRVSFDLADPPTFTSGAWSRTGVTQIAFAAGIINPSLPAVTWWDHAKVETAMSTPADVLAAIAAKVLTLPDVDARMLDDFRDNLEKIPAGETRFQLQGVPDDLRRDSNHDYTVMTVVLRLKHKLLDPDNLRGWTEGPLLGLIETLLQRSWWVAPAIAGIHEIEEAAQVSTSRVVNEAITTLTIRIRLVPEP